MRRILTLAVAVTALGAVAAPAVAQAPPLKRAQVGNFFINPGHLAIKRGTKVTWKWTGGFHNVTVTRGPAKFHSQSQAQGTFSHVFGRTGTYRLICTIHPFMTQTVVVK